MTDTDALPVADRVTDVVVDSVCDREVVAVADDVRDCEPVAVIVADEVSLGALDGDAELDGENDGENDAVADTDADTVNDGDGDGDGVTTAPAMGNTKTVLLVTQHRRQDQHRATLVPKPHSSWKLPTPKANVPGAPL